MANKVYAVDDDGACYSDGAKVILCMCNTEFYDVQNPKSPNYDPDFPKHFYMRPSARRRSYLVRELRDYVRRKAAQRDAGNV